MKRARRKSNGEPRFERKLPEARRLALIEATIESLKRFGHEGLSIRRISAQARVSIGLINHHFPTKDALVAEAYRHFNNELVGSLRQAVANAPPAPRARLRAFLEASFSPPNLDSDVLAVWVVFWGLYRHSKDIQRVQSETYHGYVDLLRGMLADLEREVGALRFNLRLAAIGLTSLIDGLWLEWCLDPDNFEPREAVQLCEAWIDRLGS
ncbi:MAG TPA: TetR family transcriptional regulator C-terminal domain-containing protein [Steroidobacteraceae bacterium]|nr:TetR family transcriptional regulator C-terminal domain-containing protein [Steroidobacteraceae bacterium]